MLQITFEPGAAVCLFDVNYVVAELIDEKELLLRTRDGAESRRLSLVTLLDHYGDGHLKPGAPDRHIPPARRVGFSASSFNPASLKAGAQWLSLLNAMQKNGIQPPDVDGDCRDMFQQICESLGIHPPPHRSTVMRKYSAFLLSGRDPAALAPKTFLRGGPGKYRISAEVQGRIDDAIHNLYLTRERRTIIDVHRQVVADVNRENLGRVEGNKLQVPAWSTVMRNIKRLRGHEVYAARWGKRAAELKYRQAGSYSQEDVLGTVYEVDHTPLDLFVVDPLTRMPCGRPRLTVMTERKARAVVGFDIGFDGNSAAAVLRCLKHALLPKQDIKQRYPAIHNDWPCFGRPSVLRCDNGKEFHSNDLEAACLELGIELEYCAARQPWTKGAVERFFRSVNKDFASLLPGATSSHFYERPEGEDPSKLAVIDLEKLHEFLHIWVIDSYMQSINKNLKATPYEVWKTHFHLAALSLPASREEVDVACRQTVVRRLQHYGIDICGCASFNHPALGDIRRRHQFDKTISVQVKYDATKLDRIFVRDPDSAEWVEVLNSDPDTASLSEFQVKALNKLVLERKRKGFALSIIDAKTMIADEISYLRASKTQNQRRRALKLLGFANPLNMTSDTASPAKNPPQQGPADVAPKVEQKASKAAHTLDVAPNSPMPPAKSLHADEFPTFESVVRSVHNTMEVDDAVSR